MRQVAGSLVCPSCGKLVGVNEPRCPYCDAWRPGLFGFAPVLQRLVGNRIDLVSLILMACISLYAAALLLQPEALLSGRGLLSFLSPGKPSTLSTWNDWRFSMEPWVVVDDANSELPAW